MKVQHVVARMGRDAGGLARSSQGFVAALCKDGIDAWIWSLDGAQTWFQDVRKAEIAAVGSRSRQPWYLPVATAPLPQRRKV